MPLALGETVLRLWHAHQNYLGSPSSDLEDLSPAPPVISMRRSPARSSRSTSEIYVDLRICTDAALTATERPDGGVESSGIFQVTDVPNPVEHNELSVGDGSKHLVSNRQRGSDVGVTPDQQGRHVNR